MAIFISHPQNARIKREDTYYGGFPSYIVIHKYGRE